MESRAPVDSLTAVRAGSASGSFRPMLVLAAALLPLAVAALALAAGNTRLPGDVALTRWLQRADAERVSELMYLGEHIASPVGGAALAFAAIAVLFVRRRTLDALALTAITSLVVFSPLLKMLYDSPRPDVSLVKVFVDKGGTGGFPSSHVFGATLLFGAVFIMAPSFTGGRWSSPAVLRTAMAILIALVLVSRSYLGLHWPSEAIETFIIALTLLLAASAGYRWGRPRVAPGRFLR